MTEKRHSKLNRIVSAAIVVIVLALVFSGLGKTIVYFKTGADNGELYVINTNILKDHHPKINWEKDQIGDGRIINEYMRDDLEKAYIEAWYVANLSFANKDVSHLKDYFAGQALEWIQDEVNDTSGYLLHQTELNHNLQLHHFTPDNQLAAFSDNKVSVIRKIVNTEGQLIYEEEAVFDYDVVMVLDDGRWRIKHLVKSINSDVGLLTTTTLSSNTQNKLDEMRGVNYYPAATPWFDFWENYSADTTKQDLRLAKSIGLNTVRIFLQYEIFGGAMVKDEMLEKLSSFLDIADDQQIDVIVTLFDFPKSYELLHYTSTDRHLEKILTRFKNHNAILAWDLKNEPDLDFDNYGKKVVTDWLSFAIKRARIYAPNHLITVGWSDASAAHIFNEQLDFVSFHYYKEAAALSSVIRDLKVKCNGKKLVLGEFGQTSLKSLLTLYNRSEEKQAEYYEEVFKILDEEQVSYISWALYDFENAPVEVFGRKPWISEPQKYFGLFRSDKSQKPASEIIAKYKSHIAQFEGVGNEALETSKGINVIDENALGGQFEYHRLGESESLTEFIASRNDVTLSELMRLNGFSLDNPPVAGSIIKVRIF